MRIKYQTSEKQSPVPGECSMNVVIIISTVRGTKWAFRNGSPCSTANTLGPRVLSPPSAPDCPQMMFQILRPPSLSAQPQPLAPASFLPSCSPCSSHSAAHSSLLTYLGACAPPVPSAHWHLPFLWGIPSSYATSSVTLLTFPPASEACATAPGKSLIQAHRKPCCHSAI